MILELAVPFVTGVPHADVEVDYPSMAGATDITLFGTVDTAEDNTLALLTGGFMAQSDFLTSLIFPNLASVGGTFGVTSGPAGKAPITTLSFPSLASSGGFQLGLSGVLPNLLTVSFPSLSHVGSGGLGVNAAALLANFSLPALANITGQLSIGQNPALTSISLNALTAIGSGVIISGNALTGVLSFPNLMTTADTINVGEVGITELSFPSLTTIGGGANLTVDVGDNTGALATLNIPSLVNFSSILVGPLPDNFASLVTVHVAATLKATNVLIVNAALSQTSVDDILVALVAGAQANGTVDLSGGTSSTPGATGIAAAATLTGNGWTVNTN